MTSNSSLASESTYSSYRSSLVKFTEFILRERKILLSSTLIFLSFGIYSILTSTPIYSGSFEIVLRSPGYPGDSTKKSNITSLMGLVNQTTVTDLATQVKILESPLVLLPVHNRLSESTVFSKGLPDFLNWRDSLNISLQKGTEVLTITYSDTDSRRIYRALDLISKQYQDYSKKIIREGQVENISFLENERRITSDKLKTNRSQLNKYSLKYGLNRIDSSSPSVQSKGIALLSPLSPLSPVTPKQLNLLPGNQQTSRDTEPQSDSFAALEKINRDLEAQRIRFKDTDPIIQRLLRLRAQQLKYIERTAGGKLPMLDTFSRTSDEAHSILDKFSTLNKEVSNQEELLSSLEATLLDLRLKNSKALKPWQLISEPYVFAQPTSKGKKEILLSSLFYGILTGALVGLVYEKLSQRLYDKSAVEQALSLPLLGIFEPQSIESIVNAINLLADSDETIKSISLVNYKGLISEKLANNVSSVLSSRCKCLVKSSSILSSQDRSACHILLVCQGSLSTEDCSALRSSIGLIDTNVKGFIWLRSQL